MSGEFGSYMNGYFDSQIEYAAQDCREGRDQLTRLWGEFLAAFQPVARAICYSEEYDSGPDYPITEMIRQLPALKAAFQEIEQYIEPYQRVADDAVRRAIDAKSKESGSKGAEKAIATATATAS